jgi:hypothetical protein
LLKYDGIPWSPRDQQSFMNMNRANIIRKTLRNSPLNNLPKSFMLSHWEYHSQAQKQNTIYIYILVDWSFSGDAGGIYWIYRCFLMASQIESSRLMGWHATCRMCTASRRSSTIQGKWNGLSGKYEETRNSCLLSVKNLNGSRHLVFWSLGTLTGLKDRVRKLVA